MSHEAILPLHVDSTMITCARSCLEKFRLEFVLGLRPGGISIDLHAGGVFASTLEAYRKAFFISSKSPAECEDLALAAFEVAWGDFEIPDFKRTAKTKDRMWDAICGRDSASPGYFTKYPCTTDHIQPYFVSGKPTFEFTFAIPLEPIAEDTPILDDHSNRIGGRYRGGYDPDSYRGKFPCHPSGEPFIYSGRFDMLGKYQGKPVVEDDKTTGGSISTGWSDKWALRNQFMGYIWACQQSGLDLDSVAVRGIAIQKTQIVHAEVIKPFSNDLLARWHEQTRRDLWRIRRAWDTGYFDYNFADTCTSYGNCIFMNVCSASDANKSNWYNDFAVNRWNPLGKNPIASEMPKP